jgi:hypothetical protein
MHAFHGQCMRARGLCTMFRSPASMLYNHVLAPCSQRRASVLQWNPEVATQLVVASDDDRSPTLQMWDLRNAATPIKEFVGHSKVCGDAVFWGSGRLAERKCVCVCSRGAVLVEVANAFSEAARLNWSVGFRALDSCL